MGNIIKFLEEMSEVYHNDRPSYNVHQRIFLHRRWEAIRLILNGVNKRNYKKSLQIIERLIDLDADKNTKDGKLLNLLATEIERYESKAYPK